MELVYDMLLPAFTGIMVSFLVAKLVAMALRCEQVSVDTRDCDVRGGISDGADNRALLEENYESDKRFQVESSARATKRFKITSTDEQPTLPEQQAEEPKLSAESPEVSVSQVEKSFVDLGDEFPAQLADSPEKVKDFVDSAGALIDKASSAQSQHVSAPYELACPDSNNTEELVDSGLYSAEQTLQFRTCEISSLTKGIMDTEVGFLNDRGTNDSDKVIEQELLLASSSELPSCGGSNDTKEIGTNQDGKLEMVDAGELGVLLMDHLMSDHQTENLISREDEGKEENRDDDPQFNDDDTLPGLEIQSNDDDSAPGFKTQSNDYDTVTGSETQANVVDTVLGFESQAIVDDNVPGVETQADDDVTVPGVETQTNDDFTVPSFETQANNDDTVPDFDTQANDADPVPAFETQSDDDYTVAGLQSLNNDSLVANHPVQEVVMETAVINAEANMDKLKVAETNDEATEEGKAIDLEINSDAEDWEGIERSELERDFARAVNFVQCGGDTKTHLIEIPSDVIMQLYALQKIAMEGPCHESAPMALKLSARAKWNAWNDLGSMTPDEAMERYISIISDKVPGWMDGQVAVKEGIASTSKATEDKNSKDNTDLDCKAEGESPSEKDELHVSVSSADPDQ